jgi:NADH-quinone oxidoreductase subunit N
VNNAAATTPFLIVSGAGVLALMLGLLPSRRLQRTLPSLAGAGALVAAGIVSAALWGDRQTSLADNFVTDRFTLLLNFVFIGAALATLAFSWRESSSTDKRGEYAGLILLATAGMMLVAAAGTTIVLFLGIELLSVALYVLCAIETWRTRSLEAGLKYLIVGAVGSAFFLYGLALLYGASGTTVLSKVSANLTDTGLAGDPLAVAALVLIVVGLAFKASAVPFHMWTPDVYEGAPTPISAFMATGTKAAALAAFMRVFSESLLNLVDDWKTPVAIVAAVTIIVGNVAALRQDSLKRMLAYSGIAQAGYLLIGVAAGTLRGTEAVLYYLFAYLVMTLAAFAVVIVREREVANGDQISSLRGYGRSNPVMGIVLTLAMLSLAGIPPLSGFIGKFLLFGAAVDADLTWLAIVGAVGSMISLGYYLRVLGVAWLHEPRADQTRLRLPASVGGVAVACAVLIVVFALGAGLLVDLCQDAAQALFTSG